MSEQRSTRLLFHPIALAAMALTWVNDHHLKALYGNVFTGKLSDFAGLAFFPFWVLGSVEALSWLFHRPWHAHPRHAAVVALLVALGFSAIKTHPVAEQAYRDGVAQIQGLLRARAPSSIHVQFVRDPTDLVALPMLSVCYLVVRRYRAAPTRSLSRIGAAAPRCAGD